MEAIQQFFVNSFGELVWLAIIIFAMLPITEARLAIPFGLSVAYWGDAALSPWIVLLCGYIGSLLPTIILLFALRPLFRLLKKTRGFKKLFTRLENYFKERAANMKTKERSIMQDIGIILFVGVPLPLTGVWTGSAICAFLDMKVWRGFADLAIGNLIACSIIMLVCTVFKDSLDVIIIILCVLVALYIIYFLLKLFLPKKVKALGSEQENLENTITQIVESIAPVTEGVSHEESIEVADNTDKDLAQHKSIAKSTPSDDINKK